MRRESVPLHGLRQEGNGGIPFQINSLESMTRASRAGYPHRHSFYQILYVTRGRGSHVIDFASVPVRPPCLYFVSPGQVHFWQLDEPLEGKVLLFSQDFLILSSIEQNLLYDLAFFHAPAGAPSLFLEARDGETFAGLIASLETEYLNPAFGSSSVVQAYLHILLVQLQRRYQAAQPPASQHQATALVRHFKKLVSERFVSDRTVTSYARALGLSAGHLSETVKAVTRITAGQLIREEVTTEAKRLLAHSDLGIAEIAYRLNFEDPSYFGRFFRREAGLSPGAFRKTFREKYQTIR